MADCYPNKTKAMGILDLTIDKVKEKIDEACEHGQISNSERVLSVVAGGFILGCAVKRVLKKPLTAVSCLTLGAALVTRGITGKCAVKGALDASGESDEKDVTIIEHRHFVK
ncbi:YgaP-like transmembrane domain [Sphingobacterium deserti]|nr:YgaP-like transmembrane domain [Sphingobacterium deserti]